MPIGKLLILPAISSSANFQKRIDREAEFQSLGSFDDDDEEIEIQTTEINQSEGDGDLKSPVSSKDVKEDKILEKEATPLSTNHSDGDHGIIEKDLQKQEKAANFEIQNWINSKNIPEEIGHVLTPVFLSKESFFKSYSTSSEINFPHQHSPHCSSQCLNINTSSSTSSTTTTTTSSQTEDEAEIKKTLQKVKTLHEELTSLEEKNSILKKEIQKKNKLLQKYELSIHELSNHRLQQREASIQDICKVMREYVERRQPNNSSTTNLPEAQTVLLTTTPEINQLIIGALTGYLGAYGLKNFGKTLCMALSGGTVFVFLGCQHGFIKINWKQIGKDFGLDEESLIGTSPVLSLMDWLTRKQISRKYPYAIGGFLGGLFTGLMS